MRLRALSLARAALLTGPTVLAFWSGGYFDSARNVAGLVAWLLVAVALLAGRPLPRARSAWLALGGLGLLASWTLASAFWAPIPGVAYHAGQRVVLYAGAFLTASLLLRSRAGLRALEPMLAAGTLVVVGYGLSERLLPGLLQFHRSISAFGRLEQPLTYWNAMGEVAAIGVVLCARIAGDASRSVRMRMAAAAGAAPLAAGLYLSLSRGALFACAAGLITLIAAAPKREQLRATVLVLITGAAAALVSSPFHGVTALNGPLATREREGAIVLAVLAIVMAVAAGTLRASARRDQTGALRLPGRAPWIALALICAGLAVALLVGAKEPSPRTLSAGATRYATLQSNRYTYWRVAMRAFRDAPLRGVGAGGWAVYWLRLRPIDEFAVDAHSLPIQTLAELGLVGLALLAAFLAGIAWAARDALRYAPVLSAGPLAGVVAWVAHAPLDWDWQMPAVTLIALVLAGGLVALADLRVGGQAR